MRVLQVDFDLRDGATADERLDSGAEPDHRLQNTTTARLSVVHAVSAVKVLPAGREVGLMP